ncbi:hypothetical protein FJY94_08435 [Candidatus Kaiserbacteria bacterium]|nr:hypothetical protein [Candidatus Kaiserbacteria bacterium]
MLTLALGSMGCNQSGKQPSGGGSSNGPTTAATVSAATASAGDELAVVLSAYSAYYDGFGKGPDSWPTLLDFARKSNFDTGPLERTQQRGVQITWSADMGRLPNGASGTVFAQGGGAPTMMFDGFVKRMD